MGKHELCDIQALASNRAAVGRFFVGSEGEGQAELWVEVEYDGAATDPDSLAAALDILMETALSTPDILMETALSTPDILMETALSTPDILSDCGDVSIGEFSPVSSQ